MLRPALPEDAQVALTLRLLCGFTIRRDRRRVPQQRAPLLKNASSAERRLLASSKRLFDLRRRRAAGAIVGGSPHAVFDVQRRLSRRVARDAGARRTLPRSDAAGARCCSRTRSSRRRRRCALCALMYLHAARLPARVDGRGDLVPLAQTESRAVESRTDRARQRFARPIGERAASSANITSKRRSRRCTRAPRATATTDWDRLLWLYDILMRIRPSPVIALNRAIAVAQREGPESRHRGDSRHSSERTARILSVPSGGARGAGAPRRPRRSGAQPLRGRRGARAQPDGTALSRAARRSRLRVSRSADDELYALLESAGIAPELAGAAEPVRSARARRPTGA